MRLRDKRVLITGSGGGQGAAAQAMFVREGARVVGCDLTEGAAERTADALRVDGIDATGYTVDLADPAAACSWVDNAASALGAIDVLYNNAAGFGFSPFAEMSLDLCKHVIRVELDVVFHTPQPAWQHVQRAGGASIINTASMSGVRGIAPLGQAAHAATKGGVIALTKTLAAEGAEDGICVNAISPGFVKTPATDAAVCDNHRAFQMRIRRPGPVMTSRTSPSTWRPISPRGSPARVTRSTGGGGPPLPVSDTSLLRRPTAVTGSGAA